MKQLNRTALVAVRFPNAAAEQVALALYRWLRRRERQSVLRAGENNLAILWPKTRL